MNVSEVASNIGYSMIEIESAKERVRNFSHEFDEDPIEDDPEEEDEEENKNKHEEDD